MTVCTSILNQNDILFWDRLVSSTAKVRELSKSPAKTIFFGRWKLENVSGFAKNRRKTTRALGMLNEILCAIEKKSKSIITGGEEGFHLWQLRPRLVLSRRLHTWNRSDRSSRSQLFFFRDEMFCRICVSTDPTQESCPIDHAGYTAPTRQRELDHTAQESTRPVWQMLKMKME